MPLSSSRLLQHPLPQPLLHPHSTLALLLVMVLVMATLAMLLLTLMATLAMLLLTLVMTKAGGTLRVRSR
jgi:hypothetical protein